MRFCIYSLIWFIVFFHIHRLFGVTSLTQTNCSSTWMIIKNQELHWYHHANPILLLVMYYTLATLIRLWLQEPIVRVTPFFFSTNAAGWHGIYCKRRQRAVILSQTDGGKFS